MQPEYPSPRACRNADSNVMVPLGGQGVFQIHGQEAMPVLALLSSGQTNVAPILEPGHSLEIRPQQCAMAHPLRAADGNSYEPLHVPVLGNLGAGIETRTTAPDLRSKP